MSSQSESIVSQLKSISSQSKSIASQLKSIASQPKSIFSQLKLVKKSQKKSFDWDIVLGHNQVKQSQCLVSQSQLDLEKNLQKHPFNGILSEDKLTLRKHGCGVGQMK